MKFKFIWLGQTVLKYEVPLDIFYAINDIYEKNVLKLDSYVWLIATNISKGTSNFKTVCPNQINLNFIFLPNFCCRYRFYFFW